MRDIIQFPTYSTSTYSPFLTGWHHGYARGFSVETPHVSRKCLTDGITRRKISSFVGLVSCPFFGRRLEPLEVRSHVFVHHCVCLHHSLWCVSHSWMEILGTQWPFQGFKDCTVRSWDSTINNTTDWIQSNRVTRKRKKNTGNGRRKKKREVRDESPSHTESDPPLPSPPNERLPELGDMLRETQYITVSVLWLIWLKVYKPTLKPFIKNKYFLLSTSWINSQTIS